MNVLRIITPLLLAAIGILLFWGNFLLGNEPPELKTYAGFFTVAAVAGCIAVDICIKKIFKPKIGWLWIIELLLILVPLYLWIIH